MSNLGNERDDLEKNLELLKQGIDESIREAVIEKAIDIKDKEEQIEEKTKEWKEFLGKVQFLLSDKESLYSD